MIHIGRSRYKGLLPMALRRTELWFEKTDATGRDLTDRHVQGAWFIETMTQFGTFLPSEKGYHCAAIRDPTWSVDWAGNEAINLHREGSVELLHLALDYFDHTQDETELLETIVPLSVAVTDFVASYYASSAGGAVEIWPTQSLEGYRPGDFPPTKNNTIVNDLPWVAGLHAVLPRLLRVAAAVGASGGISAAQVAKWQRLHARLPPLPVASKPATVDPVHDGEAVFTAGQEPYPAGAVLGGSEQPYMCKYNQPRISSLCDIGRFLRGFDCDCRRSAPISPRVCHGRRPVAAEARPQHDRIQCY